MDEPPDRATRVRALLAAHGPDVDRLCDACVAHLPGISGAGLALMTPRPTARQTVYASDRTSAAVEESQFTLGEGPCVDAYRVGEPVLAADLSAVAYTRRWPAFTAAALAAGAQALFALPLQIGAVRLGVIDLYRKTAGPLDGEQLADALVFADAATQLILFAGAPDPTADLLVGYRAAVHQATGMVRAQLEVPIEQAFVRLRAYAYAEGRPLDDVARDVVERRLRFDRPND